MSLEGEINLDDLIKKEREQNKAKKVKQIHKEREARKKPHFKRQNNDNHFDRKRHDHPNPQFSKPKFHQKKEDHPPRKPLLNESAPRYALSVSGFVSDVSIQDICNLAQNRKILSIKTQLRRKDQKPINVKTDNKIEVIITFSEKEQADSFINEYSEKVLDGKHRLSFSFIDPRD